MKTRRPLPLFVRERLQSRTRVERSNSLSGGLCVCEVSLQSPIARPSCVFASLVMTSTTSYLQISITQPL